MEATQLMEATVNFCGGYMGHILSIVTRAPDKHICVTDDMVHSMWYFLLLRTKCFLLTHTLQINSTLLHLYGLARCSL